MTEQCRFCLEESPVEELIAPCKCEGTGRFVHAVCLRRWQREVASDERAAICQVCRTTFSLSPPPPPKRIGSVAYDLSHQLLAADDPEPGGGGRLGGSALPPIFDAVRTNPRYDRAVAQTLPGLLRERMRRCLSPGCLVLQTPARAAAEAPQQRQPRHGGGDHVLALFEAVLVARMAHWHRGVFLLGAMWHGQASDGSDALLGVNLAGVATALGPLRGLRELEATLQDAPISGALGGPVRPDRSLALVTFQGPLPTEPLPRLVRLVLPSNAGEAPATIAPQHRGGLDDMGPPDETGHRSGSASSSPLRLAWRPGSTAALPRHCSGALFGEPQHVAEVLAAQTQLRPLAARIFQGHAVWSSAQLLCEVARGSWGLTKAMGWDLVSGCHPGGGTGGEHADALDALEVNTAATAPGSGAALEPQVEQDLWTRMWGSHAVLAHPQQTVGIINSFATLGDDGGVGTIPHAGCPGSASASAPNAGCLGLSSCAVS